MRQLIILILVFTCCFSAYGQVKVNANGKFFNYNGIKIYYEDTGKGEPLLLLHSFFGTADQWKPYVGVYAKQFRTIAVDMMDDLIFIKKMISILGTRIMQKLFLHCWTL
jgi:hypothetical protein